MCYRFKRINSIYKISFFFSSFFFFFFFICVRLLIAKEAQILSFPDENNQVECLPSCSIKPKCISGQVRLFSNDSARDRKLSKNHLAIRPGREWWRDYSSRTHAQIHSVVKIEWLSVMEPLFCLDTCLLMKWFLFGEVLWDIAVLTLVIKFWRVRSLEEFYIFQQVHLTSCYCQDKCF